MSAPKRYPAPLGDTPHPLMSETSEGNGEGKESSASVFNLVREGEMEQEGSHHRDPTKGGRTLGRRAGLLVSGRLHGSGRRMVSARGSTKRSHAGYRGVLDQWLAGSGSIHHERRTLVRLRSPPVLDSRTPRNTTSKRLNSSIFFGTRRKSHRPG